MTTTTKDLTSKNPTELLRDQVMLLEDVQTSLQELQRTETKILESLAGMDALTRQSLDKETDVSVVDIDMSFGSMVGFMVKWSIAAIPAAFILFVLGAVVWVVLTMLLGGATGLLR